MQTYVEEGVAVGIDRERRREPRGKEPEQALPSPMADCVKHLSAVRDRDVLPEVSLPAREGERDLEIPGLRE